MQSVRITTILLLLACGYGPAAEAADQATIQRAIGRGADFLRGQMKDARGGERSLMALALYKAGDDKHSPAVEETLREILGKFDDGGKYRPGGNHLYEAAVDATFLADLGGEEYKPQIAAIAGYIVSTRLPNGGWDYPGQLGRNNNGDTSVIQYCALGLWAAERVGVEIEPQVWADLLAWHIKFHEPDGGYAYCPGHKDGDGGGAPTLNMTAAALCSIHIALMHLQPGSEVFLSEEVRIKSEPKPEKAPPPKFGVLEAVEIADPAALITPAAKVPAGIFEVGKRAYGWLAARYRVSNEPALNRMYYYYTIERMAALANLNQIGTHDWYNECADYLIGQQREDGGFVLNNVRPDVVQTSFGVLFLTRSTGKLLKRKLIEPGYGDGLLAGGRGLPDDLTNVDFNGREISGKQPPKGPLDQLLASLQNPGDISIDDVQEQIVEQVQIGDRETLVGQKDLLVKLVNHPDPGVRQTAMWAIGRTDDLRLARYLIDGLSDIDANVMMEAQNALCWIARRPKGIGLPENPLDAAPDGANPQQRQDAVLAWRAKALQEWGTWYLEHRPYADRSDQFEAKLKQQLDRIKKGQQL